MKNQNSANAATRCDICPLKDSRAELNCFESFVMPFGISALLIGLIYNSVAFLDNLLGEIITNVIISGVVVALIILLKFSFSKLIKTCNLEQIDEPGENFQSGA